MYQVMLGNNILYYPSTDEYVIYDTELRQDVGQAGEFIFKVPPINPLYDSISQGMLITILKDKKEYWRGEIQDISIDFAKVATVYCLEDFAWLGDEYLQPAKITNQTYKQRLDAVIAAYNSSRPAARQFKSGYVYNGSAGCNWKTEYEWSILDSIRKCICRDGMYVRLRRVYESGVIQRYIDVVRLQEYGKTTSQPVEYGYNLLDYVKESDYGNLTNVLTPYGDELEDAPNVYDGLSSRLKGTTIANSDSVNTYGRHAKAVVFDGVTNVNTLNNLASAYLSRYCQPQLTMEVTAVDLAGIENVADIEIGDQVRIVAKPFAVDQYLYLTEITRDLQNIDKNTLTLSGNVSKRTLTNQIAATAEAVEELPTEWDLLKAAKANALAMLLDETQGGYVVFEYDDPNDPSRMTAINVCNAYTIAASTQRWRWSQNGLGYMERKNINQAWSELKVAMTKDGHMVADFMDTGTLTAAIIKAGILSDKNGQFSLNMTTGQLIMNSGTFKGALQAATGSFAGLLLAATGTFAGNLSAAGGTFKGNLQAAGGTFSGNLSAAGGTFKGNLQAAGGTFSGALSAATGTFSGTLSAATGSFSGTITATGGRIGSASSAWNIGEKAIYNGPDGLNKSTAGTYVGIDGFRNNKSDGSKYTKITDGKIETNDVSVTGGSISGANITSTGTGNTLTINGGEILSNAPSASNNSGFVRMEAGPSSGGGHTYELGFSAKTSHGRSNPASYYAECDSYKIIQAANSASDERLKENIEELSFDEALAFLKASKAYSFNFKKNMPDRRRFGLIAQEFKRGLEDAGIDADNLWVLNKNEFDGMYCIEYPELVPHLIKVVTQQQEEIELLKEAIKTLKGETNG